MFTKTTHYIILHFTILIWGLTGILGDAVEFSDGTNGEIKAVRIVFFRTAIALLLLFFIAAVFRLLRSLSGRQILICLLTGVIIAMHWFAFFYSIEISTVAIGVVCMSMMAFFTALIEPWIDRRKISPYEIILSIFSLIGMGMIFKFEFNYVAGIIWGLVCALLASVFTLINSRLVKSSAPVAITSWEMLGACVTAITALNFFGENPGMNAIPDWNTAVLLFVLGLVCTAGAFLTGVWIVRHLSPFTVSLSLNLEPVYTILILLVIDFVRGTNETVMSTGFYAGTALILLAVAINGVLRNRTSSGKA